MKIEIPQTLAEVQSLVTRGIPENLHLDYKRSDALKKGDTIELTKDASAFANSDGGCLIYGVIEEDHIPIRLDGGVDMSVIDREWLENILLARIQPRLDGLVINVIPLTATHAIFCVAVARTFRGPHQAEDKKYYKRFNFKSEPMEDYETRDVRSRVLTAPPLVNVDLVLRHGALADLVVQNLGPVPAHNVKFSFEGEPHWHSGMPPLFRRGLAILPPGQRFQFYIKSMFTLSGKEDAPGERFTVLATYLHPATATNVTETFPFDLHDYWGTQVIESDAIQSATLVTGELKKIHDDLSKVADHLKSLNSIAGATGLDLSVTAIRNLAGNLAGGPTPPKMNPSFQEAAVFMEVLGVDWRTAAHLEDYFRLRKGDNLERPFSIPKDVFDRLPESFDMQAWKRGFEER
jgi:hypothetical protein